MNNEYTQTKFVRVDQDDSLNPRSYAPFLMTSKRLGLNNNKQSSPPIGNFHLKKVPMIFHRVSIAKNLHLRIE